MSNDIDKRISDLKEEATKIRDVYKKLVEFVHANSLLSINKDTVEYLQYFIREEQMKRDAGDRNVQVKKGLQNMVDELIEHQKMFEDAFKEQKKSGNTRDVLKPENVFGLVSTLYQLPITGKQIREQIDGIILSQEMSGSKRENFIQLPATAAWSKVMTNLKNIMSAKRQ